MGRVSKAMLELVIVRHGESVRNHATDLARQGDTSLLEYQLRFERDEAGWDLTQKGVEQARTAGEWIRSNIATVFDAKFESPFKRTLQTAANLGLGDEGWIPDDRLREREWGDYSAPGMPPYTPEQYLADLRACSAAGWKRDFPGAESIADMIPRCRCFVRDLFRSRPNGKVILVTHGGTMKSLQLVLEHLESSDTGKAATRRLTNCSVLEYRLDNISVDRDSWTGEVRFSCPALVDCPSSGWQPIAGRGLSLAR